MIKKKIDLKMKSALALSFLFFNVSMGTVYAQDDERNNDIRHVENPVDMTFKSEDGTFKAGAVQIPVPGHEVNQKGDVTIIDNDPTRPGVGATYKFNKD